MQNICQSLLDTSQEFFEANTIDYKLTNGIVSRLKRLPSQFLNLISAEVALDLKSHLGFKKLKITDEYQRLHKYYRCNYSLYSNNPDISIGGSLGVKEFVNCKQRGHCAAEGLICKFPCGLTKRQAQISNRIANGQSDCQICSELFISQNTLRSHKNSIETKTGCAGKVSIGVWATESNLKN